MASIILKKQQEIDAIHKRCKEDSRFEGNPQNSCLSKKVDEGLSCSFLRLLNMV